jgi:hypothetical protein
MLDPLHGYSVKGTYAYLTMPGVPSDHGQFDDVWLKEVSLKVSVFVWRLLRTRIPTKENLFRRRASFLSTTFLALLVVVLPRLRIISYFIVHILEWCGIASFSG